MAQEKPFSPKLPAPQPAPNSPDREEQEEPRAGLPAQGPISADWQRRIQRELEEGEKAVWSGQPDEKMALMRPVPRIAAVMGVLLVLEVGLLWIAWNEVRQGVLSWLLLAILLGAGLVGLPFLALWSKRLARRTCYAVTTRRALVFQPSWFGKLSLISYFPAELEHMTFHQSRLFRPDAGDLVFRKKITTRTMHYINEGRIERSETVELFGFLMLREARKVRELIVQQLINPRREAREAGEPRGEF